MENEKKCMVSIMGFNSSTKLGNGSRFFVLSFFFLIILKLSGKGFCIPVLLNSFLEKK